MNVLFKPTPEQSFEFTLALYRYQRFWEEHEVAILDSFFRHTGLKFRQRQITVRMHNLSRSASGYKNKPMLLNPYASSDQIGPGLMHEFAHRLLGGNGINVGGRAYAYHAHRYIDLFLYDVWKDVLGKEAADAELASERSRAREPYYARAWGWAIAMSYEERQVALRRIIKRRILK